METNEIDFVPTENADDVFTATRAWMQEHVVPHLGPGVGQREDLDGYNGGYLGLRLGGPVAHPQRLDRTADCDATISIRPRDGLRHILDVVEDPEGTQWWRSSMTVDVSWPSYGSNPPCLAVPRAAVIATAARLAGEYEAAFGDVTIWTKGRTKAQRAEADEAASVERERVTQEMALAARRAAAADTIKTAIHTTHRLMRVGSSGTVGAGVGVAIDAFTACVERKTYDVRVYEIDAGGTPTSMTFVRTL